MTGDQFKQLLKAVQVAGGPLMVDTYPGGGFDIEVEGVWQPEMIRESTIIEQDSMRSLFDALIGALKRDLETRNHQWWVKRHHDKYSGGILTHRHESLAYISSCELELEVLLRAWLEASRHPRWTEKEVTE